MAFPHGYHFDPTYGYGLERLLQIGCPDEPPDFAAFWQGRYARALELRPEPRLSQRQDWHPAYECHDIAYRSTDDFTIHGWLLIPKHGPVRRGVVVGHGYGGRDGPDYHLPAEGAAFLFPCFRGLSRSQRPPISNNPAYHVLHDIDKRDRYILGGCVEDVWLGVSALLALFPDAAGHVGYMGASFGGGIGALALPWDGRIRLAHLAVPTFGHVPLRLGLPTLGSGEAVRGYEQRHGNVLATLRYYDAACAARRTVIPVHVAAALFDPVVAPPGQFAIYNALPGPKELFVLEAGHFDYPRQSEQDHALLQTLAHFFSPL
ncbi:acetylxylan esterase [Methylomagnum ishizawai]|uniref:acetylxylan esterase n=1 Tax=Methylomagnum ishizawai TaxID=1760988 RepID=UPI001C32A09C|nr:acetylxylan esterase [Methylomagnum ishizawai]BBL73761.1 deacetylase [Methylomagnum ishizawai]